VRRPQPSSAGDPVERVTEVANGETRALSVSAHHPIGRKSLVFCERYPTAPHRARGEGHAIGSGRIAGGAQCSGLQSKGSSRPRECSESVESHECFAVAGITAELSWDPISTE